MRLCFHSQGFLFLALGAALFLMPGCFGRYAHNAKVLEKACAEIDQKHPGGTKTVHQVVSATEWPPALLKEQPQAVEIFDGAVWVFFHRSKGEMAEGYVYDAEGKPKTDTVSFQKTSAPHLYYFTWRP